MEPFRQKGSSKASWSTFIFKSVLATAYNNMLQVPTHPGNKKHMVAF